jgi:hypothetical protein
MRRENYFQETAFFSCGNPNARVYWSRQHELAQPNKKMKNTTAPINHIEAAIMFVRACGPVTKAEIAREIRIQVQGATKDNCDDMADKAITHGLDRGWLEKYDEESFCIA